MTTNPPTDRVTAIYDAIDGFQRTHRLPGLQHAQLRGLLAEHLARALPAAVSPPAATDRATLRDRIAEALYAHDHPGWHTPLAESDVEPVYRERAVAALGVLPPHADRGAVLREAADRYEEILARANTGQDPRYWTAVRDVTLGLRRLADEAQPTTEAQPQPCAHCGKDILRRSGTLTVWWVHDPGGNTSCFPQHAASSTRATPKPVTEERHTDTGPVKESTRRYAAELRGTPGTVVADGHTGWECDAGASLIVEASTPGPGKLGTHHGVIYACAGHRAAAEERITGAGYEVDPRPAPPGHRWNPWPCGHVTAHDAAALAALAVVDGPTAGARQDGAQQ